MAQVRSPWRLLRPVLLAGAATLTWLTLSTSAATADSSADSGSLLGGVTSSVSSLSSPLTRTIVAPAPAPAPTPAPVAPSAAPQPVVGNQAGAADLLVTEAPVLDYVVPAGAVSAVTAPVAAVADDATAGLVNTIAPPLTEAVPVVETLLEPVTELVDGVGSLPDLPVGVTASSPVEAVTAGSVTTSLPASSEPDAAPTDGGYALAGGPTMAPRLAASGTTAPIALAAAGMHPASPGAPLTQDPSAIPSPIGPTSGAGSGAPSSGSSGSASWLDTFGIYLPLPGAFRISGPSEHAPSPVSFDPGSSPD